VGFFKRRVPGKLVAVRAVIWCLFSVVWVYLSWVRIAGLRAAGRPVDWKNWAIFGFWSAVLVFWAVIWVRSVVLARRRREFGLSER
jgi:hypothetical protein